MSKSTTSQRSASITHDDSTRLGARDYNTRIGAAVQRLRRYAGMSVTELHVRCGIPLSTLRSRLDGTTSFPLDEISVVAEMLGTQVSTIARLAENAGPCCAVCGARLTADARA